MRGFPQRLESPCYLKFLASKIKSWCHAPGHRAGLTAERESQALNIHLALNVLVGIAVQSMTPHPVGNLFLLICSVTERNLSPVPVNCQVSPKLKLT